MPGIVVSTAVRVGPTSANPSNTATAFFAGVAERGPSGKAQAISSFSDYEEIYGGFIAAGYLHQTVKTYFEEGGARAYISRVVPTGAATATLALQNSDTPTPATVMTLTASGAGVWANTDLRGAVEVAGATFRVVISLGGASNVVYRSGYNSSVADAVEEINNNSTAALYITATAAAGTGIPAVKAATLFSGGSPGSTTDGTNVVTALGAFIPEYGPGSVSAPGFTDATTYNGLIAHAKNNNRIALLGFAQGTSIATASTTATTYAGDTAGQEFAAFFYPWVTVPVTTSLSDTIPCEGFVAAKRAQVHNGIGAWYSYAGAQATAQYVNGLETSISKANVNTLSDSFINPLRIVQGAVRVYGARTLSTDTTNFRFLNARETLNLVTSEAEDALEQFLFRPIDARGGLFAEITSILTGILERIRQSGGLYELISTTGQRVDSGYSVIVNQSLNPLTQLAEGTIKAKVGARVSPVGETIELEIVKSTLDATLV